MSPDLARERFHQDIEAARRSLAKDPLALTAPAHAGFVGRRFRDLFLREAALDAEAVAIAKQKRDDDDPVLVRQRLAERFLKGEGRDDHRLALPAPVLPKRFEKTTLVFCPGLLNGMLPVRAFREALPIVEQTLGIRVLRADAHPMRGCDANVADLHAAMSEGRGLAADTQPIPVERATPPEEVILVGYSKGMTDVLTYLVAHPEVAPRVRAVISWAGAIGGSHTADGLYGEVRGLPIRTAHGVADAVIKRICPVSLTEGLLRRHEEYDVLGALHDLTTTRNRAFLEQHLPTLHAMGIPFFQCTGSASLTEVPYFQLPDAMKLAKWDPNNDMQLTQEEARLPGSLAVDLAVFRGHHWDLSYGPFPSGLRLGSAHLDHPFPKLAAMTSLVKLAAELGLAR